MARATAGALPGLVRTTTSEPLAVTEVAMLARDGAPSPATSSPSS